MDELTEEIVNKIFLECYWPYSKWKDLDFNQENGPIFTYLAIPLLDGSEGVTYYPEKLSEYSEVIGVLLDQVLPCDKEEIHFYEFNIKTNGKKWTKRLDCMEMLYTLGVATEQILTKDDCLFIKRVEPRDLNIEFNDDIENKKLMI